MCPFLFLLHPQINKLLTHSTPTGYTSRLSSTLRLCSKALARPGAQGHVGLRITGLRTRNAEEAQTHFATQKASCCRVAGARFTCRNCLHFALSCTWQHKASDKRGGAVGIARPAKSDTEIREVVQAQAGLVALEVLVRFRAPLPEGGGRFSKRFSKVWAQSPECYLCAILNVSSGQRPRWRSVRRGVWGLLGPTAYVGATARRHRSRRSQRPDRISLGQMKECL